MSTEDARIANDKSYDRVAAFFAGDARGVVVRRTGFRQVRHISSPAGVQGGAVAAPFRFTGSR